MQSVYFGKMSVAGHRIILNAKNGAQIHAALYRAG